MAVFKPFYAIRPKKGTENFVAALPYDVYSREEAFEYVKNHPDSFLKIDRAESQFGSDVNIYDDCVYEKAGQMFRDYLNNGLFLKDKEKSFFLYEETMDGRSQLGLVGLFSAREYEDGIVKKYENTRRDKEEDRVKHINALNAQTGPVFLAYEDDDELNDFFKAILNRNPEFDFVFENNVRQRGFKISDPTEVLFVEKRFLHINSLYIADGHHRCQAAYRVHKSCNKASEADYIMGVAFPKSELMIMDYNRVVKDLNGLSEDEFLKKVSERFFIKEIPVSDKKPEAKRDIYMFLNDKEYVISPLKEYLHNDPVKSLDVSVLQDLLLEPVLNIKDPKTDSRIDFVGGIRGIKELRNRVKSGSAVAFALYPTAMSELFAVADMHLLMPPKSTWFEPKLLSGLFIHEI